MEKILEKIIETDCSARKKVAVQKERLNSINSEIAAEKSLFEENLKKDTESVIESTKKDMQESINTETHNIDLHFEETKKNLQNTYDENHDKWVDDIFKSVIK